MLAFSAAQIFVADVTSVEFRVEVPKTHGFGALAPPSAL